MATITDIKLKRSATAGKIPLTTDLDLGEIAINTYDGKLYIKKDVGGTESIVLVGPASASDTVYSRYIYTATASQTTFTGADDNSNTLAYDIGYADVYVNGVKLITGTDFTATSGSSIVMATGLTSGDIVEIIVMGSGSMTNLIVTRGMNKFVYTATASQTTFSGADDNTETLAYAVDQIQVYFNGALLDASDYTASNGTSVVLGTAADAGDIVTVVALYTDDIDYIGDLDLTGNLTVSGNATIAGNLTFGNADTDTVEFAADVNSNVIPDLNNTYDLGSSSKTWRNIYSGTVTTDSLSLGDNDKATFGAGNDLEIYSDGANAVIDHTNTGAGALFIKGDNNVIITNQAGTENKAVFASNGAVSLYYDNATKFATTNTGIDVTGTATMDGLTVDASSAELQKSTGSTFIIGTKDTAGSIASPIYTDIKFEGWNNRTSALIRSWDESSSTGFGRLEIKTNDGSSLNRRALFDYNGDISFYEDTGTTPKFFWDASAEMLAVGTTNTGSTTGTALRLEKAGSTRLNIVAANVSYSAIDFGDAQDLGVGKIEYYHANNTMYFSTNAANRMVIDSSGKVGIGTSSPLSPLHITATNPTVYLETSGGGATDAAFVQKFDNDFYIWNKEVAGKLFLGTNNSTKLTIDSSGNVGIGTTSPDSTAQLHTSTTSVTARNIIESTSASGYSGNRLKNASGYWETQIDGANQGLRWLDDGTERMRITSTGNVGIGASSVLAKLHVRPTYNAAYTGSFSGVSSYDPTNSEILVGTYLGASASSGDYTGIRFQINGNSSGIGSASIIASREAAEGNGSTALSFLTRSGTSDTSERMRITSSGNVGIGDTNPSLYNALGSARQLVVGSSGGSTVTITSGTSSYGHLAFATGTATDNDEYLGLIQYYHVDNSMRLYTNSTEKLRIASSGNVGIGTTSPAVKLAVSNNGAEGIELVPSGGGEPIIQSYNRSGAAFTSLRVTASDLKFYAGSSPTERMRIDSSGNVGIGTSSPTGFSGYTSLDINNATSGAIIDLSQGDVMKGRLVATASTMAIETSSSVPIIFQPAGTEAMRINSSGKVGIGDSNPSNILTIAKTDSTVFDPLNIPSDGSGATILIANNDIVNGPSYSGINVLAYGGSSNATRGFIGIVNDPFPTGGWSGTHGHLSFGIRGSSFGNVIERTRITSDGLLDHEGEIQSTQLNLDPIATDIADTAVDVFVYDTRKDSDGGAWRKRTQHTSWYNETLNTATRGSRKEFPAVAVIVSGSDIVTIYDGDDPAMPMWMVFNGASGWLGGNTNFALSAKNGILAAGGNDTNQRLRLVYFLKDHCEDWATPNTGGGNRASLGNFLERNTQTSFGRTIDSTVGIIERTINDVAMTVLPNAPIDAATGLPVPTIAVATDGGVSVIKDDGTVVDIVSSYAPTDNSDYVEFTKSGGLILDMGHNGDRSWLHTFSTIPSSDTVVTVNTKNAASGLAPVGWYDVTSSFGSDLQVLSSGMADQIDTRILYGDTIVATTGLGMTFIDEYTPAPSRGMTNFIASDYNTGWMNGDIKLATLSDTDDTDVTGSELVTNGDFSSSTGWSVPTGVSISGGVATYSSPSHGANLQQTATSFVSGKTYTISVEVTAFTSGGITIYYNYSTGTTSLIAVSKLRSVGVHSFTWTALGDGTGFTLQADSVTNGACILTLDNVSVRIAEEDRSVNNNGLQVFGTVTKTPVATGADLVAYSGWSQSGGDYSSSVNYLHYPNTIALGTSDFHFAVWLKFSTDGGQQTILSSMEADGQYAGPYLSTFSSGTVYMGMYTANQANAIQTPYQIANGAPNIADNTWHQAIFTKSGTNAKVYIDGEFTVESNSFYSTAATFDKMNIGANYRPFNGSIALLRLSATAPSPEQIKKMYNDEKFLFQENAKCTLYGSSNAVTALAYDDDTELLHVGTSAGRSVFQGLRRIDNTTDAVGAAISASNGMVAED